MKMKIPEICLFVCSFVFLVHQCSAADLKTKLIKLLILTSLTKKSFLVLPLPFPLPLPLELLQGKGGLGGKMPLMQQQPAMMPEQWPSMMPAGQIWAGSTGNPAAGFQNLMASFPQMPQDDWSSMMSSDTSDLW